MLFIVLTPLLAILVHGATAGRAQAADTNLPVLALSVQKLDPAVTLTTITTAFATPRDIIQVYNYAPVEASSDWRRSTSMDNATWVFKPGGGAPKLAIFFTVENGQHVARLYDDSFGQGSAPITLKGNHVILSQPVHWSLQAETPQPWIQANGLPADNLWVEGAFSLPHEEDARSIVAHRWHGHDAWDYRMADPQGNGIPTYTLQRMYPQVAETAAVPHTTLDINVANYHIEPFTGANFWPYLGVDDVSVRSWFDRRPPLSMNWATGQLRDFGSIIPDLEPEFGMQIYSDTPVVAGQTTDLDFENPFAYYRFDSGESGFPNLIIRRYYFPAGDQYLQIGGSPQPVEYMRYSWGNGDGNIQYKLGLLGRNPSNTTLPIGDATIQTMDYTTLPAWTLSHVWDFQVFVASETGGFRSSEGIYVWDYVQGDFSWAFGVNTELPLASYQTIDAGYRGEYRVLPSSPPQLYVSPIDRRLHLLGAEQGSWNIDNRQTIHTATLDGQTVGQWVRSVDGVPREALTAVPQALLYAADGQVIVQPAPPAPPAPPLSPARDEATLTALRQATPGSPPDVADLGLRALLPASDAGQVQLSGATLDNVRVMGAGWQAELHAAPEVGMVADAGAPSGLVKALTDALGCSAMPPTADGRRSAACPAAGSGVYLMRFDGTWNVQPLSPAVVTIQAVRVAQAVLPFAEMPVTIAVANAGQAASSGDTIQVWAQRPGRVKVAIANLAVTLPGQGTQALSLNWLPPFPGEWTIGATLTPPPDAPSVTPQSVTTVVSVAATQDPSWWTLGPVPSSRLIGGALGLIVALGLVTGVVAWSVMR